MRYRTTHTDDFKVYDVLFQLTRLTATVMRRLFAAPDAVARRHGWQVTSIRGGFGRQYRDPRFDTLRVCVAWRGRGATAVSTPCDRCSGTDRLVVEPAAEPSSGG